ncbi:hypothetical protein B0I35DRAFT_411419 [Stachybotrys elegans]|uniref:Transcription factor domain-containing protein n=1 Tax=Stachybotrys elegans TaxID=80388 RepID=A0A8K0SMS9_9HYPO|nr:hypothetical protein B0I35DRAFT_411419 [Stachybotrys elegans]
MEETPIRKGIDLAASQQKRRPAQRSSASSTRRRPRDARNTGLQSAGSAPSPSSRAAKSPQFTFIQADSQGRSPTEARRLIRSQCMVGKNIGKRRRRNIITARRGGDEEKALAAPADRRDWTKGDRVDVSVSSSCTVSLSKHDNTISDVVFLTACLPGPLRALPALLLQPFAESVGFAEHQLLMECTLPVPIPTPISHSVLTIIGMADFTSIKNALYPVEICFEMDPTADAWFHWMLSDPVYKMTALLLVSVFRDMLGSSNSPQPCPMELLSPRSIMYFRRSMSSLRDRIEDNQRHLEDGTAAIISALALAAEVVGDDAALAIHMEGMKRIVHLKGGLDAFNHNGKLQVKLCRVDLGWALKTGCKPQLCDAEALSWASASSNAYASHGITLPSGGPSSIEAFIECLDTKLRTVFQDLHSFSSLANHLIKQGAKVKPQVFQEMMLSVQYRLLLLAYTPGGLHEALRVALLTYQVTLFMPNSIKLPFAVLRGQLHGAIQSLDSSSSMLRNLKLWMLFNGGMGVLDRRDPWYRTSTAQLIKGSSWADVEERLKAIMWVDAVHQGPAKCIFDGLRSDETEGDTITASI